MIREAQADDIEAILKFIYTGQVQVLKCETLKQN